MRGAIDGSRPKMAAIPIWRRIAGELEERIASGEWQAGNKIPSRRDLSAQYGVNLLTIQRAVANLVETGLLRGEGGSGTYVTSSARHGQALTAASPRRAREPIIGIIAHDSSDQLALPYERRLVSMSFDARSPVIIAGIEEGLAAAELQSRVLNTHVVDEHGERRIPLREAIETLLLLDVTAFAFVQCQIDDVIRVLREMGIDRMPFVFAGERNSREPVPIVYYNDRHNGNMAASHLISRGCNRFIYFGADDKTWAVNRLAGVRDALHSRGFGDDALKTILASTPHLGTSDPNEWIRFAREALSGIDPLLMAGVGVVASNDFWALAYMEAAARAGLSAGSDYKIIGFDDVSAARECGLTSLRPPLAAMGAQACALLRSVLAGNATMQGACLRSLLVMRASTSDVGTPRISTPRTSP